MQKYTTLSKNVNYSVFFFILPHPQWQASEYLNNCQTLDAGVGPLSIDGANTV